MKLIKNYSVKINGMAVKLESARVSKYPFNRHWPGHQRPLDQTEVTAFASFDLYDSAEIEISCGFEFEKAVVRPLSLGISPVREGNKIRFTITKPCQCVVEFDGTSGALHLFADPPHSDPIPEEDTLYFGPGKHDIGRIELKSGQTVYIDKGAVVYGEIYGIDVANVRIIGKGILDHSKVDVGETEEGFIDPPRPSPIKIEYGRNIEIKDIVIRDPCFLALRPICCEDVRIKNVKILGNWRYNSDGIDILNCRRALIENCFVRSFDDSYCVKGFAFPYAGGIYHNGKKYDIAEDITFRGCIAYNEWGKALEVGIDLCASEIRRCKFENCDVIHVIGSVMDVSNFDYAAVSDIVFDNIRVEYDDNTLRPIIQERDEDVYNGYNTGYLPPLMCVSVCYSEEYSSKSKRGTVKGVRFNNIRVTAPIMPSSFFAGFDSSHGVTDVRVKDLYLNGEKIIDKDKANFRISEFADDVTIE